MGGGGAGECQCKVSLAGCNCNLLVIALPGWFPHCECVAPRISSLLLLTRAWPPVLAHVHLLQYLFAAPRSQSQTPILRASPPNSEVQASSSHLFAARLDTPMLQLTTCSSVPCAYSGLRKSMLQIDSESVCNIDIRRMNHTCCKTETWAIGVLT